MDCAPPSGSQKQNYFSIDDILMSSEKMPCHFQSSVQGLGFLDAACGKRDIVEGTKMDVPLWMATVLGGNPRSKFAGVEIIKPYREVYRQILRADAAVVDLRKLGPYYYAIGQQILIFDPDESILIARSLVETFSNRFRKIMDWSTNALKSDFVQQKEKLDEVERKLFSLGQQSLRNHIRWESGNSHKIIASDMIVRHRKRKREEQS